MNNSKPVKIAIASGKGGTGKTLISTNLASYISEKAECLLVDLDVEEPNSKIFIEGEFEHKKDVFKAIPQWDESRCTLCGECTTNCKFHAVLQLGTMVAVFKELCHSCYACSELCPEDALPMFPHKIGEIGTLKNRLLTFMECRLSLEEEQAVPLINQSHDYVNQHFSNTNFQLFDCPPGTSCPVIAATKHADFVVLATEPTPFGLNDLRLAVDTMRGLKKNFGVVINRYGIGDEEVENYCNSERIPILARIPFDRKIAEDYSQGKIAIDRNENLKKAISELFTNIENHLNND